MKRIVFFTSVLLLSLVLSGCSMSVSLDSGNKDDDNVIEPRVESIREICELCALECTYHNVAMSVKEADSWTKKLGKKDRKFWIEYEGTAKISFDLSEIKMKASGNTIYIQLPDPKIEYDIVDDSWNEDSYIKSEDSKVFFLKNKITYEDELNAIAQAQEEMKKTVEENDTLIKAAKSQAKAVIESYIDSVGQSTDKKYTISWNYDEAE